MSLLLSSHALTASIIDVGSLNDDEIFDAFNGLEVEGDMISQIGAVELGLAMIDRHPRIVPILIRIIEKIVAIDGTSKNSRCHRLSALFVLVDGELGRTKTLKGKPPFWRRLAALAQASIIERAMIHANVDIEKFAENVYRSHGQIFYLQNFLDLRVEPRWHPDYAMGAQLKAEFIGRIMSVARANESKIIEPNLHALLFGDAPDSVQSLCIFPASFFPGPLEGNLDTQIDLLPELVESIETQLNAPMLHVNSFAALVNSALIFRLGADQVELVGQALRTAQYQIKQVSDSGQLQALLYGLATVAAVTRSANLADDVIILMRNFWQKPEICIQPNEAMAIGLVAAAAHPELSDWCKFVGNWMTELAFKELERDDALMLQLYCKKMCHIVPELWQTCGKADAALTACLA